MSQTETDRAILRTDNNPPFPIIPTAQMITDEMARLYAPDIEKLDGLLAKARDLPKLIEDDQTALNCGTVIKEFRDLDRRFENVRETEKDPYLRACNALDAMFNGFRDKIGRRNKNDRKAAAGAADIIQARINDYQDRKIAEERAARERQAAEDRRIAREAQEKADRLAREEQEAREKAERARKPENVQQHSQAAEEKLEQAVTANVEAETAAARAEESRIATLARAADMARVRGNDESGAGVTLTVAKENFAILTDRDAITDEDKLKLFQFFTDAEVEKAVRGFAKNTGYRVKMAGAEIGTRNRGVTR